MSIATELDLHKYRRMKIVATIGPASADPSTIAQLIEAGVDVFRVNMSHGEHSAHRQSIAAVRECADRLGIHTAVLADLCGPKIRTGKFVNGSVDLIAGRSAILTTRDALGDLATIPRNIRRSRQTFARVIAFC